MGMVDQRIKLPGKVFNGFGGCFGTLMTMAVPFFAKFKGSLSYNIANLMGREFKRVTKTRFFLDAKLIGSTVTR